ncbi:MAG: type II toxin-antitoxin system HicA family toxin [Chloroflexi bacterium]|nr:type II toxin-antitoxin system HicA family toxin [Chloroflexota bacterium]
MSLRLPDVRSGQVVRVLEALGFLRIRQSGSHATYRHPNGRWTIVSIHPGKTISKGTLRKIIRDTGLTVDDFVELL